MTKDDGDNKNTTCDKQLRKADEDDTHGFGEEESKEYNTFRIVGVNEKGYSKKKSC